MRGSRRDFTFPLDGQFKESEQGGVHKRQVTKHLEGVLKDKCQLAELIGQIKGEGLARKGNSARITKAQ